MKKLTLIVMAGLLMLGLTQCKKEQSNTNAEGEWVDITVKVDEGDRHIVYPGTGAVLYSNGDVIYVGNAGKYVGQLTYANGAFRGSIYNPQDTDYLHFYFLGGKTPSATPTPGSTENFTVDISDQRGNLPVLSYGHSTQKYTTSSATYGCTLENQCALVKFGFDVNTEGTDLGVTVSGLQTTAAISFADPDNAITTATGTPGSIKLYHETNATKWAILLPQAGVTGATATIGSNSYTVSAIPTVGANDYVTSGVNVYYNVAAAAPVFTVASGRTVQFSPGNLQYHGTSHEWRFAEHQWDVCQPEGGTWITSEWVDFFCWGTWGYGKDPLNTSSSHYTWSTDFIGTLNGHSDWRTLTHEEWVYLFNTRADAASKYGFGKVDGTRGVVILPDSWALPTGLTFTPGNSHWGNNYNTEQWAQMEAAGAVFLPAAGCLFFDGEVSVLFLDDDYECFGCYWSATPYNNYAYAIYISGKDVWWEYCTLNVENYYGERRNGFTVRLVR